MTKEELLKLKIGFISLGCDKNRVDLEKMISRISQFGFKITNDATQADIIIINTCAFLIESRRESIETILEYAKLKERSNKKIIVTGCLPQYTFEDVPSALPEVDRFVELKDDDHIIEIIAELYGVELKVPEFRQFDRTMLTTPSHYAYLKISEGCNNFCSYCTIPYIRGRYHSYFESELVDEARKLVAGGVRELILVAQDVTKYGTDFDDGTSLVTLIRKLSKIKDLVWIRLLYCYPEEITDELIEEMATNEKVCKYIDIPLQHINDKILRLSNRKNTKARTLALVDKLRRKMPDIALRTTYILGLPSETKREFRELCDFVRSSKFSQVGFFTYSREVGTIAATLKHQVPEWKKRHRLKVVSRVQQEVLTELNNEKVGQTYRVVVDSISDGVATCRSQYECPDVDSVIYCSDQRLEVGKFYDVKITETFGDYDLKGELNENK